MPISLLCSRDWNTIHSCIAAQKAGLVELCLSTPNKMLYVQGDHKGAGKH